VISSLYTGRARSPGGVRHPHPGLPAGLHHHEVPDVHLLDGQGDEPDRVHQALDSLSERQRIVLEWKYLESLPVREMAERWAMQPYQLLEQNRNAVNIHEFN